MADDPPKLRVVGDDERVGDGEQGRLPMVLEDLDVAHGHVVEATAELRAVAGLDPGGKRGLLRQLEGVSRAIERSRALVRTWISP